MRVEDYELEGELGRGAMGVVYRARHKATGALHALKRVELLDAEAALRFEREASAMGRVGGPGLVPVHGVVVEGRRAWLAMGLLEGGTLRERLRQRGGRPWAPTEAAALVLELTRAVARCHAAGLVHRDLKPENVLFSEDGRPHVADLGLVKDLRAASLTATGTVLGTPAYMAPEQLLGLPAGPAADVFALGAILHELLAGAPAFAHLSPVARALDGAAPPPPPGTPPRLARILAAALDAAPERRPPDAAAFARELEAALVTSRRGDASGGTPSRALLAAGGLAVVVLVGGLAAAVGPPGAPPPAPAPPGAGPISTPDVARAPSAFDLDQVVASIGSRQPLTDTTRSLLEEDPERARAVVEALLAAPGGPAVAVEALRRLDDQAPGSLLSEPVAAALDPWAAALAAPVVSATTATDLPALASQATLAAYSHELASRGDPHRLAPPLERVESLFLESSLGEEPEALVTFFRACLQVGGLPTAFEGDARKACAAMGRREVMDQATRRDALREGWTWDLFAILALAPLEEEPTAEQLPTEADSAAKRLLAAAEGGRLTPRAGALCWLALGRLALQRRDFAAGERLAGEAVPRVSRPDLAWRVRVRCTISRGEFEEAARQAEQLLEATACLRDPTQPPAADASPAKRPLAVLASARRLAGRAFLLAGHTSRLVDLVNEAPSRDHVLDALLEGCRASRGERHDLRGALDLIAGTRTREELIAVLGGLAKTLEDGGRPLEASRLRDALPPP